MEETVTKRLHVSGITPAITPNDLSRRLGSFGAVKAVDGFGLLNALGQPRKFGYVTLETTKPQLARCMNLLSGVTWKGAKLRIGEAKPDFHERIVSENAVLKRPASADGEPPKKRRRLPRGVQGVHAQDMSLVTPEDAGSRGGWHVTALGRLIRPIRMRPEHPLPDPISVAAKLGKSKKTSKEKEKTKTRKKRTRDPPTRARRRTIDPTKWGSQLLTGAFLEGGGTNANRANLHVPSIDAPVEESDSQSDGDDNDIPSEPPARATTRTTPTPPPAKPSLPPASPVSRVDPNTKNLAHSGEPDLVVETRKSLGLLQSLFGDNEEEWGGQESIGSDVDMEDAPAENDGPQAQDQPMKVDEASVKDDHDVRRTEKTIPAQPQAVKLKDLFAPREEETGYSLLGHLDLDLELDDEVNFGGPVQPVVDALPEPIPAQPVVYTPTFDEKRALFFPVSSDVHSHGQGRVRDVLDQADWRTWFFHTDTAEDIQTRWQETRGELTSEWKRRHREAVKSRRRRGGGGPGEEM